MWALTRSEAMHVEQPAGIDLSAARGEPQLQRSQQFGRIRLRFTRSEKLPERSQCFRITFTQGTDRSDQLIVSQVFHRITRCN